MTYSQFRAQFNIKLNRQQEEAVKAIDGPVLLLAVPGSGKTTVLVTRIGYMLYCRGVAPESILTMTYTVSAAADMRGRFGELFGGEFRDRLEFRTINAVAAGVIRRYERVYGVSAFELLSDEGRRSALVSEAYKTAANDFPTESAVNTVKTAITYIKNMVLTDEETAELRPDGLDVAPVYAEYCRLLRERGQMDYDDQLVYAYRILRRCPDILEAYRRRYVYLCVDEAQDTSRIQHMIIRLLAGGGNLFMVGDEDQSIYGFRAAYPEALMRFSSTYEGARTLLMERNYRSTRQIVAAADRFISQNKNRHPKRMTDERGSGAEVLAVTVKDRRAQYRYLAAVAEDCAVETAVLYRDNDSALPLIDMLDRRHIPYRCRRLDSGFFSHWAVRDITDIIRFSQNPCDGELFMRIYYKLGAGISKLAATAACTQSGRSGEPILECIAGMSSTPQWTRQQCRALKTHFASMSGDAADRAVYRILNFMGYGEYLAQRGADTNKAQILSILGSSEPSPTRLLERLEELSGVVSAGSQTAESGFVISTIHSSKGLEYDRVFLMDAVDGVFPKSVPRRGAPQEDINAYEEERRLFYVGMTRAKNQLMVFRFTAPGLVSTFAAELFPEKKPAPKKPAQVSKKPIGSAPKVPQKREIEKTAQGYAVGDCVLHKSFGGGRITERSDDIITVRFDSGEVKRLMLTVVLRAGLLKKGSAR